MYLQQSANSLKCEHFATQVITAMKT